MKIIIVGAGDVGFHIAKLLSFESQDIYLIDTDLEKLEYASNHIDVITLRGDATSISILKEARITEADIFLAVTESQNTNFTLAVLAKKLGAKKTIARISNHELVQDTEIDFKDLGIDSMISPGELAADEINLLIEQTTFNDSMSFENGALNIWGGILGKDSPLIGLTVKEAKEKYNNIEYLTIALKRDDNNTTIIPRGDTVYEHENQVYFSAPQESAEGLRELVGKSQFDIKDVMILGGSKIGIKTARNLNQKNLNVKLIETDKQKSFEIAEKLPETLVINGDARNVELLEEENISEMDAFIAVTGNSETNIMSCLVAKSKGVKKTIALVENMDYINISKTIGIDTLVNKKLLAASAIFKYIRKGDILKLVSVQNLNGEILEFKVKANTAITQKPIKELGLTKKAVFGGVIREGKPFMTYGDFQIIAGDKVVVFCLPEAIGKVEKLFN